MPITSKERGNHRPLEIDGRTPEKCRPVCFAVARHFTNAGFLFVVNGCTFGHVIQCRYCAVVKFVMQDEWHAAYQSAFLLCLNRECKNRFDAQAGRALEMDREQFVSFFAQEIADVGAAALRGRLTSEEGRQDLKAFLFVVFRAIDTDDSDGATWKEVVEYALEERMSATEVVEDASMKWKVTSSRRYSTEARLKLDSRKNIVESGSREGVRSRSRVLPFLPVSRMTHLEHHGLLLANTGESTVLLRPNLEIIGELPSAGSQIVAATVLKRPVLHYSGSDLAVTSHRDGFLRIWTMKDSLREDQKTFELEFEHEAGTSFTALCGCRETACST